MKALSPSEDHELSDATETVVQEKQPDPDNDVNTLSKTTNIELTAAAKPKEGILTVEEAERTKATLRRRFESHMRRHEGVVWSDVEASLDANPEALWSLALMESEEHEPDVYDDDEHVFRFATCSREVPESTRDCVYDKEAADLLEAEHKFNGNAMGAAEALGLTLLLPERYKKLLSKDRFDEDSDCWLLTAETDIPRHPGDVRRALRGCRNGGVSISAPSADSHTAECGWRGEVSVKKVSA